VQACPLVHEVVVATTDLANDDPVVLESERYGAGVFRGSETDVLSRYFFAAKQYQADIVVRVTSDCPLIDPALLCRMLRRFHELRTAGTAVDYLSNTLSRTYPRGLDAEIFLFSALARAYAEGQKPEAREHVTPYIWGHPEIFRLHGFTGPIDLSRYRWTLDTADDYAFLLAVYAALGDSGDEFSMETVLSLLAAQPELVTLNAHVAQRTVG
jgi:spore coat polysaccharide biosynthesis protein SpsF